MLGLTIYFGSAFVVGWVIAWLIDRFLLQERKR